jgi:hypothetical protein
VKGHPRVSDRPVTTSAVVAVDPTAGWARTLNHVYSLGSEAKPGPGPGRVYRHVGVGDPGLRPRGGHAASEEDPDLPPWRR